MSFVDRDSRTPIQGEYISGPIPRDKLKEGGKMSEMKQVSPTTQAGSSPKNPLEIDSNAAQNLTTNPNPSLKVFDKENMQKPLDKSLETGENAPQRVGSIQHAQKLETMLQNPIQSSTPQHVEQPKSGSQSATGETATHHTITGAISSGHPHLDEETSTKVQKIINHTPPKNGHVDDFIERIKQEKFLEKEINGKYLIDFKKLGLSKEEIKEAGIKGKIFKNTKGEFDIEITGQCSPATVKCLRVLKQKLEVIQNSNNSDFATIEINIEPNTAGPLNANDLKVLENHGLIKYKIIPNSNQTDNNIMKLILDPGKDEKDDGLMVAIYNNVYDLIITPKLSKIPLKVVFEGDNFNEKPGINPLLPNWRNVFELSSSSREAQKILWNTVDDYLKASVKITEGHHDTDNEVKSLNIQTNELSSTSNTSTSADLENATTISENQQGEIYSNQLQALSEKAKQGNLTERDVDDFRKTLPAPVQNYLNNYLNINNIKSIPMNVLRSKFKSLTPKDCQKIGYVIAHEITPQDIKTIKFETEIIEIGNTEISKLKAPIKSQENFIDQLNIIENLAAKSNNHKLKAIIKKIKVNINENNYKVLLSAITKFKKEVDKLLEPYKNEAHLTINLGQIHELCNNLNADFKVTIEDYSSQIKKLLQETNYVSKTKQGVEILEKLITFGIQNDQITNKIKQLSIAIEGDDNNINRLLALLTTYNSQKTQHYAAKDEYLKDFANWIAPKK